MIRKTRKTAEQLKEKTEKRGKKQKWWENKKKHQENSLEI